MALPVPLIRNLLARGFDGERNIVSSGQNEEVIDSWRNGRRDVSDVQFELCVGNDCAEKERVPTNQTFQRVGATVGYGRAFYKQIGGLGTGNPLGSLGTPHVDWADAIGGNGIYYDSCWINNAAAATSYQVLSFREIPQATP